ncbi:MAG: lipoyl(octanoyl) transferase LipB [Thiotrichales bacterium]
MTPQAQTTPHVDILVKNKGLTPYAAALEAMRRYTDSRTETSPDEIWLLQHPPVYTQGQAGKAEHLLNPGDIPVLQTDRGGQVTYHGPGQVVAYLLLDLRRRKLGVRACVDVIEHAVISLLDEFGITAESRADAPGVYVNQAKIASLGLRIRHGCSYHGVALNVDMNLEPFSRINPCGFAGLKVTQLRDLGVPTSLDDVAGRLAMKLKSGLGSSRSARLRGIN